MNLTHEEQEMLAGKQGRAVRKAMEILVALGTIYGADSMLPVSSVQIAGVSYDNLGEAGLEFLQEMADGDGKARVPTTLNPAGMDLEDWPRMGIQPEFARKQTQVIEAFSRMGVMTTCSCTPYLFGNLPHFGEHIAWSESSAICFANSVLGARTNREGGPSALAAALTGRTPAYGLHRDQDRRPILAIKVEGEIRGTRDFGALGAALGKKLDALSTRPILYIQGIDRASLEELKSFSASIATYGGCGIFHMEGITPEAACQEVPASQMSVTNQDIVLASQQLNEAQDQETDFVTLGCPHLSLEELIHIANQIKGRKVTKTFWITTSRPVKLIAESMGYARLIEESGAALAADTCCVVAPIKKRFKVMATDSAKACYYASSKNGFQTKFLPFDDVIEEAFK
jgi:predicted aconitase